MTGSRRRKHKSVISDINLLFIFDILNQSIVFVRKKIAPIRLTFVSHDWR